MLTLTRRIGERFHVGDDVVVEVLGVGRHRVKLGIRAPRSVPIVRGELRDRVEQAQRQGTASESPPVRSAWPAARGLSDVVVPARPPILHFERGLYGFGGSRRFVLCELGDGSGLLALLDVDEPLIQLTCVPAERLAGDYPRAEAVQRSGLQDEPAAVLLVVTRPADGSAWTVNLAAPVVVGLQSRRGVQVILDGQGRPLAVRAPYEVREEAS